jgi:RNA polymerase subunit RPABC4/transcription elongation factor Spt4
MRTHCPACRNPLPDGTDICVSCGAMFSEGFTGYRGRPLQVLIGRYAAVLSWLSQGLALFALTVPGGGPDVAIGLHWIAAFPLSLIMVVMALRIPHTGLGLLAVCNIAVIFSAAAYATSATFGSGPDWSVIGIFALVLILTGAFVWRFWQRPLPPADMLTCGNCGYLLRGLVVPRCPECGTRFDPRKLARLSSHLPVSSAAKRPNDG